MVGWQFRMITRASITNTKTSPLGNFLASAIVLTLSTNSIALADCGPGRTATYSDVESIYVERRPVAGPNYKLIATRLGEVLFVGRRNVPDVGSYDGYDGSALFEKLLTIIEKRDFYSMQLQPYVPATPFPKGIVGRIILDGPDDHVAVLRCGVSTKIETYGMNDNFFLSNDPDDPQVKALIKLVDALQAQILEWPWQNEHRELRPTPAPSTIP